jgi:hypothetical protein
MAADPKAKKFSVAWSGGYLQATVYLLEALYGPDFMSKVGSGKAKTISVKAHPRVRVIGQPATNVAAHTYSVIDYPKRRKGQGAGGQPIRIVIGDHSWQARLGGSVQDFKAFLAGPGKPINATTFFTERGTEYSTAA